jgi:hypothetical protein
MKGLNVIKIKILESSIDEPQTLVETNFNQGLETLWDDNYKSYLLVKTQNFIETNVDRKKGDEFIFVGEDEEEKVLEINLAEFFRLIGGEHLLAMHEKSSDEKNMTHVCHSEVTETYLEPLEAQMWIAQDEHEPNFCPVFSETSYFTEN